MWASHVLEYVESLQSAQVVLSEKCSIGVGLAQYDKVGGRYPSGIWYGELYLLKARGFNSEEEGVIAVFGTVFT